MNINKEMITDISGVNPRKCMKCGKCSATCPAFDAMDYHPHQFVDMVENGRIEALMQSKSIWNCLSCMACVQRCPRSVEPKISRSNSSGCHSSAGHESFKRGSNSRAA